MSLEVGRVFRSPDGRTVVRVLEASPGRGVFERELAGGTGRTNAHFHADFDQRFEVLSGTVEVTVDGTGHSAGPGASVDVPPGIPHLDPYNPSSAPAVYRTVVEPLTGFVEVYFATYGDMLARGVLSSQQEFTILELMAVMSAGHGRTFAAGVPVAVQQLAVPVLGAVARARGIRATM